MATEKMVTDNLRNKMTEYLMEILAENDPQRTGSGEIFVPTTDELNDDRWIKISVIIPKDTAEENGMDGYTLAKVYSEKLAEDARKKAEQKAKAEAKKAEAERKKAERAKAKEAKT